MNIENEYGKRRGSSELVRENQFQIIENLELTRGIDKKANSKI